MSEAIAAVASIAVGFIPGIGPVAAALLKFGLSFAIGAVTKKLGKKSGTNPGAFAQEAADRRHVIRSSVSPHRVIYGRASVSGTLVFAETSGQKNEFLHLVITIAGHPIEAVDEIYLNDKKVGILNGSGDVTSGIFAGFARIKIHLGGAGEVADPSLVAEAASWTDAHVGNGIAYAYLRIKWDDQQKVFPTGIPTPRFTVRGKNDLLDPRTSTSGYTDNAALASYDFLRGAHGYNAADSEIDTAEVIAAANVCDESVSTPGGGSQTRYTSNGTYERDRKIGDVMEDLLSSMGGVLVEHQGTFRLYAAAARTVTRPTLTEDDLRGEITVHPHPSRDSLFNAVRGTYVSPDQNWQPTDFQPVTSASYQTEDGGERIDRDIELPFTTDEYEAQRLAWIELKRARQALTYEAPVKLSALDIATWDVVRWSIARLGWVDKDFTVISWSLADNGGINLIMQEEDASSYADDVNALVKVDPAPNTNLTDPHVVQPPGVPAIAEELYSTRSGGVKARALVSWAASPDAFVDQYQLEAMAPDATAWAIISATTDTSGNVADVARGTWQFRVRARNGLGIWSAYATVSYEITGLEAAPPAVTGLTLSAIGGLALIRFDLSPALDVREGGTIEFRHSPLLVGASWSGSTSIGDSIPGANTLAVLPLRQGTYLAKAVDALGFKSLTAASVTTKAGTALNFANLSILAEAPVWSGTHTSTAAVDTMLKLAGTGLVDSIPSFDAVPDLDSYGGIASSGTYDFAGGLDLGVIKRTRITTELTAQIVNAIDDWDLRTTLIDTWQDVDGVEGSEADVTVWVRETDDDPAAAPSWSAWQRLDSAEYQARAFEFQARLTSTDPNYNIHVTSLGVTADEVL